MMKYVTIDEEILALDLSLNEKFILAIAKSFDAGCFLSNQKIADLMGLSKSRVSHIISKLVKENYLDISLQYKPDSKEVSKRTITIKQVIDKVKEVTKKISDKAKEIKRDYAATTHTAQPAKFNTKTYYKGQTTKQSKFCTTYRHNWNMDELLAKEDEYIRELYGD